MTIAKYYFVMAAVIEYNRGSRRLFDRMIRSRTAENDDSGNTFIHTVREHSASSVHVCLHHKELDKTSSRMALIHAATYFVVLGMRYNTLYYTHFEFSEAGLFPTLIHTNGIWHIR